MYTSRHKVSRFAGAVISSVVVLSVLLQPLSAAYAAEDAKREWGGVSLSIYGQPLGLILSLILRGMNYVVKDGADIERVTTVEFSDTPMDMALNRITAQLGYFWKEEDGIIVIFRDKEARFLIDFPALQQTLMIQSARQTTQNQAAGAVSGGSSTSSASGSSSTSTAETKAEAAGAANLLQAVKDHLSREGKMSYHRESGMLWVRDRADVVDNVEKFVNDVNKRLSRFISIKGLVTEISLTRESAAGINWDAVISRITDSNLSLNAKVNSTIKTNAATVFNLGLTSLNRSTEKALLTALEDYGDVRVISKPCITVTNGSLGTLTAGDTTYFVSQTYNSTAATIGTSTASAIVQPLQTGLSFSVLPRLISEDEAIIYISPELTSLQEIRTITSGSIVVEAPKITMKQTQTVVRVKKGEKIIIGGIMGETSKDFMRGVPIFSKIPLLGNFFTSKDVQKVTTEFALVMEVTW